MERIGPRAFDNCFSLYDLAFENGSCIHEVGGLAGGALASIRFPRSASKSPVGAFNDSRELPLAKFDDGSLICSINGMKRTNLRLVCVPGSVDERPGSVQWSMSPSGTLMEYSLRCLSQMRYKVYITQNNRVWRKERDRDDVLYDAERPAMNDASLTRITESGFAKLYSGMSDDPEFSTSLALPMSARIGSPA
jgi:hypothetical protein